MAEFPELRKISNSDGGSTMMFSECQHANSSESVSVLDDAAFPAKTALRSAVITDSAAGGQGYARIGGSLQTADSRRPRWASLSSSDREVFNRWASRVIAMYSLLIAGLVTAMLLSGHTATDRSTVASASGATHAPAEAPAAGQERSGK